MAFPYKLYKKLSKFDFVNGLGVEDGQVVVYVGHELNDDEKVKIDMATERKLKFVVAGPITGA